MPQFMIEKDIRVKDTLLIRGDDANHIIDVLRLREGTGLLYLMVREADLNA